MDDRYIKDYVSKELAKEFSLNYRGEDYYDKYISHVGVEKIELVPNKFRSFFRLPLKEKREFKIYFEVFFSSEELSLFIRYWDPKFRPRVEKIVRRMRKEIKFPNIFSQELPRSYFGNYEKKTLY
jgi:hypothetical protein